MEIIDDYNDRCPLLEFRKKIKKGKVLFSRAAYFIFANKIFETISIMVIVANSIFLSL